jgi:hypothetical protein
VGARAQRKVDVSRGRSLVWGAGSLMTVGTGAEDVASHRAITLLAADLSNAPRADRNAILGLPPPPVSNVDHQSGTVLRKTTRQVLHVDAQLRQMTHPRLRVTLLCLSIPTLVSGHFVQLLFVTTVTSRRGKICTIQPHRRGLAVSFRGGSPVSSVASMVTRPVSCGRPTKNAHHSCLRNAGECVTRF